MDFIYDIFIEIIKQILSQTDDSKSGYITDNRGEETNEE